MINRYSYIAYSPETYIERFGVPIIRTNQFVPMQCKKNNSIICTNTVKKNQSNKPDFFQIQSKK